MYFLDLPDSLIEDIFEYLSYDEISRKRVICKAIDKICQRILSRGYNKMIKRHNVNMKRIKSLLPRRESERRIHPLARHADILTCIETRISMLSMTYSKYMDLNLCCFIPGKVIDEVFKILHLVETTTKPLRAHEVLQELRDISSMAIEHFDEKIAHLLKKKLLDMSSQKHIASGFESLNDRVHVLGQSGNVPSALSDTRKDTTCKCSEAKNNRVLIHKMEQKYKVAIKKFNRMIQIQNKHMRQMRENATLLSEMNSQILELKRRVEEAESKNREISTNISQITAEPVSSAGSERNRPVINKNIKPRTATIILKRRITLPTVLSCDENTFNSKKLKFEK